MAQHDPQDLGRVAYAAYGQTTDGRTYDDQPLPTWEELSDRTRAAWAAAAVAAVRATTTHPEG
ncbi:hypothetical protein [Streptomyces sp. SID3212]|uniref:hypothetical protein n=1 Tax=Streptomyces sp. SID3212 TaxID=2690259 RepID=UPI001368A674|nr:hypothetical protein [Streptomyces sp. SID3212]MYV56498.1 hypothetical protein [Streptomyces sp. SID3212]